MKSILRRRPSPALVIALIALFVSLSGVAYGVATGSIDSREIKDNDVRTRDLAVDGQRAQACRLRYHPRVRKPAAQLAIVAKRRHQDAFGRGAGSGSRASMAVTIIGGQILCLLLTLLITPVVYSYFDGLTAWKPSDMLNPFKKLLRAGSGAPGIAAPEKAKL